MIATERRTEFSPCRKYRYTLWRECFTSDESFSLFDGTNEGERGNRIGEYLMVIGLNPSTADETLDDPTIRRCKDFARRWGFGALCMTNLFAFRATDPEVMKRTLSAEGETIDSNTSQNCLWLERIAKDAGMILAAWGKHGSHRDRQATVLRMLKGRNIFALAINKDGSPKHPLYMPANTTPIPFD